MRAVEVHYYAVLRDERGSDSERLTTAAATAGELYDDLAREHGFSLSQSALRVAINDDFADWSVGLNDGDKVVFLPPVSGGSPCSS